MIMHVKDPYPSVVREGIVFPYQLFSSTCAVRVPLYDPDKQRNKQTSEQAKQIALKYRQYTTHAHKTCTSVQKRYRMGEDSARDSLGVTVVLTRLKSNKRSIGIFVMGSQTNVQ